LQGLRNVCAAAKKHLADLRQLVVTADGREGGASHWPDDEWRVPRIDVDPERIKRRLRLVLRWMVTSPTRIYGFSKTLRKREATSVDWLENCAELIPELAKRACCLIVDRSDQRA